LISLKKFHEKKVPETFIERKKDCDFFHAQEE